MRRSVKAAFLLLCVGAWVGAVPAASAEEAVAKVAGVKGSLAVMRGAKTGGAWEPAAEGAKGFLGDRLKTDASSVAAIEFVVGGFIGMDKATEIRLVGEKEAREEGKGGVARVVLDAGSVWARFAKQSEAVHIQTQGGVLGIEGTEFVVEEEPGASTSVSVLEGQVVFETPGRAYHVKEGEEIVVPFQDMPVVRNPGAEALRKRAQERHRDLHDNIVVGVMRDVLAFAAPASVPFADMGLAVVADPNDAAKDLAATAVERAGGGVFGGMIRSIPKAKKKPDFIVDLDPSEEEVDPRSLVFRWGEFPGADSYWFVLGESVGAGGEMKTCLFSRQVRETRIGWPADAPRLDAGKTYTWQVIAVGKSGKPASKWSQTSVTVVASP